MEMNQQLANSSSINFTEALNRMGGDEPFLKELLQDFISEFQNYYQNIVNAVVHNDFEVITVMGHTIKGSSAMLSLKTMNTLSSKLESAGKEKNLPAAKQLMQLMKNEYGVIEKIASRDVWSSI